MDATQVKKYRDLLRGAEKNIGLRLYCDNGIIIDEIEMFVNWNDTDNVVIAIKSNEDQVNHPGVKLKTIIADYEMIQYIIAYSTGRSIKPIAKKLNYTDEQIKNLINKFADPDINSFLKKFDMSTKNVLLKQLVFTNFKKTEQKLKVMQQLTKLETNNY